MSENEISTNAELDEETMEIAAERLAKILGLKDRDELAKFTRQIFPSQSCYLVFGETAGGEWNAVLVEGETKQAAAGLLGEYLRLVRQGAAPIEGAPRSESYVVRGIWPTTSLMLLTRMEVDAVGAQIDAPSR